MSLQIVEMLFSCFGGSASMGRGGWCVYGFQDFVCEEFFFFQGQIIVWYFRFRRKYRRNGIGSVLLRVCFQNFNVGRILEGSFVFVVVLGQGYILVFFSFDYGSFIFSFIVFTVGKFFLLFNLRLSKSICDFVYWVIVRMIFFVIVQKEAEDIGRVRSVSGGWFWSLGEWDRRKS